MKLSISLLAVGALSTFTFGCEGPAGPAGTPGTQGAQGTQGPAGPPGVAGAKGENGAPGAKGDPGDATKTGIATSRLCTGTFTTTTGGVTSTYGYTYQLTTLTSGDVIVSGNLRDTEYESYNVSATYSWKSGTNGATVRRCIFVANRAAAVALPTAVADLDIVGTENKGYETISTAAGKTTLVVNDTDLTSGGSIELECT